jgi:hypothetical protein
MFGESDVVCLDAKPFTRRLVKVDKNARLSRS